MVTLAKVIDVTTMVDGIVYRGLPLQIGTQTVTFKITKAWGVESGTDYSPLVRGRKITAPRVECDLYR